METGPAEVRDVFPELSEDVLYHLTEKTAFGSGMTADLLLHTNFVLFPY